MTSAGPARPRVSRETRLLLGTVLLSLLALWVLGRLRFPDRPRSANPVPAVLDQLAARSTFNDLAAAAAEAVARLRGLVVVLPAAADAPADAAAGRLAVRVRDDVAVTLIPDRATASAGSRAGAPLGVAARDAATGLAIVSVSEDQAPVLQTWVPRRPEAPRYLMSSVPLAASVSWQPVFVAALSAVSSAAWHGAVWVPPAQTLLVPGAFVFTLDGAWAGLVVEHQGAVAIVPGELVIDLAEDLMASGPRRPATVGIEVEPASPLIASVAGASSGLVVTWVDPSGPSARDLVVSDVIESAGGRRLATVDDWTVRVLRLSPGEPLDLRVRRRGTTVDVRLTAVPLAAPPTVPALGLAMSAVRGVGTVVTSVQPGSMGDRGGVRVGDVLTLVGEVPAPTPAQVTRAAAAMAEGRPLPVAVTRGEAHHVLALVK